jgi:hypothetical protein
MTKSTASRTEIYVRQVGAVHGASRTAQRSWPLENKRHAIDQRIQRACRGIPWTGSVEVIVFPVHLHFHIIVEIPVQADAQRFGLGWVIGDIRHVERKRGRIDAELE